MSNNPNKFNTIGQLIYQATINPNFQQQLATDPQTALHTLDITAEQKQKLTTKLTSPATNIPTDVVSQDW